ncbi:hypothetical protein AURDEDRAFT_176203 [Auricularia subglabra TFB-10046 SS5]|nr:hypothetical protein AURDEDRAFT_176203 [Auricularia subglabra TFB-10046 SS5]
MPPGLTEARSTPRHSRLHGVTVYIERCVYAHPHELERRNRLVLRTKSMGARIVTDLNLADLILCDGSRTVLDEALLAALGIRVLSEYIDKAYGAQRLPDYHRWTFSHRLVYPYPVEEGKEISIPSVAAVPEDCSPEPANGDASHAVPPATRSTRSKRRKKPGPATAPRDGDRDNDEEDELEYVEDEEDELDEDEEDQQNRKSVSLGRSSRSHRAEVAQPPPLREGVELVPILKYAVPPRYAFQFKEVRDWSLDLLFWFARYTRQGDPCTREFINSISTHIYTVTGHPIFSTSFASYCRDTPPFKDKVKETVMFAHVAATQRPIKALMGEEIAAFIRDARTRYRNTRGLKEPPRQTPFCKDPASDQAKRSASTSNKGRGEREEEPSPKKRRKLGE